MTITDSAPWASYWTNTANLGWAPCGGQGKDHYSLNTPDVNTGHISGYQWSQQLDASFCTVGTTEREMTAGLRGTAYSAFGSSETVVASFTLNNVHGVDAFNTGGCPLNSNSYTHYNINIGVAVWDNTLGIGLQTTETTAVSDNSNSYTCGPVSVYYGVDNFGQYTGTVTYTVSVTISGYNVGDSLIPRAYARPLTGASLYIPTDYESDACLDYTANDASGCASISSGYITQTKITAS